MPLGLAAGRSQVVGVDKNPLTRAKIELGRQLYFDPRLSADKRSAAPVATIPKEGFGRHSQFGVGISGQTGRPQFAGQLQPHFQRPAVLGRPAPSLEAQAIGPIANADRNGSHARRLRGLPERCPGLPSCSSKRFSASSTIDTVGKAIASFERAMVTGPSPFDYAEQFRPLEKLDPDDLKEDDPELYAKYHGRQAERSRSIPMSGQRKRGREIFFTDKGSCTACHVGANLTDEKYHNLGVGMDEDEARSGPRRVQPRR